VCSVCRARDQWTFSSGNMDEIGEAKTLPTRGVCTICHCQFVHGFHLFEHLIISSADDSNHLLRQPLRDAPIRPALARLQYPFEGLFSTLSVVEGSWGRHILGVLPQADDFDAGGSEADGLADDGEGRSECDGMEVGEHVGDKASGSVTLSVLHNDVRHEAEEWVFGGRDEHGRWRWGHEGIGDVKRLGGC